MSYDPMEGTSELFAALTSEMSADQWETYKQQLKVGSFYVDSDEELVSERSGSPYSDDEFIANVEVIGDEEFCTQGDESGKIHWGCDAADKYAQGKITFVELTGIMEDAVLERHPQRKICLEDDPSVDVILAEGGGKAAADEDKENDKNEEDSKPKRKKPRRKKNHMPKELEGLLGTAHDAYINGNTEEAIRIIMELIRLAPSANEPFHTLGVIYDEIGEPRRAFQCYLVAAFLNPSDTEEWIRLAGISIERNELHQAVSCYTRAIRNNPTNLNYIWERCNLYEQIGERKRALAGYELILKNLSPEDGESCVNMAREIAKMHRDNKDYANGAKILETAFNKFPCLISSEDVNLLLEFQISEKQFRAAIKTLVQHCGVVLKMPLGDISTIEALNDFADENFKAIVSCVVPEVLPIDLTVKFLVCLIHLKSLKAMQEILDSLMKENPEDMGDLFLDVAEAFMETGEHALAEPLLLSLLSTSKWCLPGVWMKYADCLFSLSRVDEAMAAYHKVIELAPSYQDARLALSKILLSMGKTEEATNVLRQDYEEGFKDVALGIEALYQRCKLLEKEGRWEEFIAAGTLIQYSHCYPLETEEEVNAVISNQTSKRRNEALRELKLSTNRHSPQFTGQSIPSEEMWYIFKTVCNMLMEQKRFEELQNISLACLSSSMFPKNSEYMKDLEFQALLSCFYNESHQYTYLLVRDLVLKYLHCNKAWNLFCLIVTLSQENRHNRFCIRLMMKNQDHLALGFLNGHNAMISGTYKHALGEYMCILKDHPNDYYVLFYVGIVFIHMACQKFATKRHLLTIQGFAFLDRYLKLKGECQETFYNIGRALHQLGIKDAAVHYYKKALFAPILISGPEQHIFDLRREIAYNLCLIYQSTGAMDLVYMYSRKYIVV